MIPTIPINLCSIDIESDKIWYDDKPIESVYIDKYIDSEGKIYFGEYFNQPINFLTDKVKWIIFTEGCEITNSLSENIPYTVEGIVFMDNTSYRSNLDNLPNTIKYLVFEPECDFKSAIDNLPNGLIYLEIKSRYFSESVSNLPQSLEVLILGEGFKSPIENLPESLKYLKLERHTNKIKSLPKSLKVFTNMCDNLDFIDKLNPLEKLTWLEINLSKLNKEIDIRHLRVNTLYLHCVEILQIKNVIFPISVHKLVIYRHGSKKKKNNNNNNIELDNLPEQLKILEISANYIRCKIKIPDSVITTHIVVNKPTLINKYICSNKEFHCLEEEFGNEDSYDYKKIYKIDFM